MEQKHCKIIIFRRKLFQVWQTHYSIHFQIRRKSSSIACGAHLGAEPTSLVSHTSAPSLYMAINFWFPLPGAKRIFLTQLRCVGIPLWTNKNQHTNMKQRLFSHQQKLCPTFLSTSVFDKVWRQENHLTFRDKGCICPLTTARITSQPLCGATCRCE